MVCCSSPVACLNTSVFPLAPSFLPTLFSDLQRKLLPQSPSPVLCLEQSLAYNPSGPFFPSFRSLSSNPMWGLWRPCWKCHSLLTVCALPYFVWSSPHIFLFVYFIFVSSLQCHLQDWGNFVCFVYCSLSSVLRIVPVRGRGSVNICWRNEWVRDAWVAQVS